VTILTLVFLSKTNLSFDGGEKTKSKWVIFNLGGSLLFE